VEHKELKLLQHPGVTYILDEKWNTFGLPLYIIQLAAYCLLIAPVSAQALLPVFFSELADGRCTYGPLTSYLASYSASSLVVPFFYTES
jgi:hypothetical protein